MPLALAVTMLNAVGLCLAGLGVLGVVLAFWQLLGWAVAGAIPTVADIWRHSGLAGELMVALFTWLPLVLGAAILFHAFIAWLGLGLLWRRPWARRGGVVFAGLWAVTAAGVWFGVRVALEDLARGYPERAGFARVAETLAGQVGIANVALGAALAWLLVQPAVRVQFTPGS
ncbi:MAG TPA: hypothetical protein VN787_02815 [Steroidobacteraceae bacterium]|nr:hypothetical protein [Steroidobacteraceae bacterium]